jgi:hypothetical protein
LDDLAALLDTLDNWEERYNHVTGDGHIFRKLSHFRDLSDDTAEATIQSKFIGIVEAIAHRRGVELESDTETKIIVGGPLARNHYDLRSKTESRPRLQGEVSSLIRMVPSYVYLTQLIWNEANVGLLWLLR